MIKLFKLVNYEVTVSEEALTLKPFKKIWDRDKTQSKNKALLELSFLYFYCDPRSDYQYLTDPDERLKAIKEGLGFKDSWIIDKDIDNAIKFYNTFKPTAALLLEDTRVAIDKVREFLRKIDLEALDNKGKPLYTISSVVQAIKQVPQLATDLDEAEKALANEMKSNSKMRGSGEKKLFEDGINI